MFNRLAKTARASSIAAKRLRHIRVAGLKYLTQTEVTKYHEDGYTIASNVLSKEEILECRTALNELIERARTVQKSNNVFELMEGHSYETPCVNRVRFPSSHHPVFKKLQHNPRILDAVEDLIGPSFRYMPQDKLNVKPAGNGETVRWHQDWAFFPHTNDNVLTASILLYDSKRENGCLQVIPKSHKGPIISHYHNGVFISTITDKNFKAETIEYLEAEAGSVTLHHARSIHGSAKNTSSLPRSTVCFVFNAMDAWPLLGVAGADFQNVGPVSFEMFNSTCIRGEICLTPRMENIPVHLPVPFEDATTVFLKEPYLIQVEEPRL